MHLVPDLSSLRIASWMEEAALVLCDVHYNKDPHDLVQYAPRSMLRRQLDRADKSGYNVLAATGTRKRIMEGQLRFTTC